MEQERPPEEAALTRKLLLNRLTAILEVTESGTLSVALLGHRYKQQYGMSLADDVKRVEGLSVGKFLEVHCSRFRLKDREVSLVKSVPLHDGAPIVIKDRLVKVCKEMPDIRCKISVLCGRYEACFGSPLSKDVQGSVIAFLSAFPGDFRVIDRSDVEWLGRRDVVIDAPGLEEADAFICRELDFAGGIVALSALGKSFGESFPGYVLKVALGVKKLSDYFSKSPVYVLSKDGSMVSFQPKWLRKKLCEWLTANHLQHLDRHFAPNASVGSVLQYSDQDLSRLIQSKGVSYRDAANLESVIKKELSLRNTRIPADFCVIQEGFAYDPNFELGHGDRGTAVYRGVYQGLAVAVKRLPCQLWTVAESEIDSLRNAKADETKHLVTCYFHCRDVNFSYLALSLCECTVFDCIQQQLTVPCDLNVKSVQIRVLREICEGMKHLHAHRMIHRDLKPTNILLDAAGVVKIADMGLTRQLVEDESHISSTSSAGTLGWQPREVLRGERATAKVDVFSFGLVAHYVITKGMHLFGSLNERVARIERDERDEHSTVWLNEHQCFAVKDLILACCQANPTARPTFARLLMHPYFWSTDETVRFLQELKKLFDQRADVKLKLDELTADLGVFPQSGWYDVDGMKEIADAATNDFTDKAKRELSPLLNLFRNVCSHLQQNRVWRRFDSNENVVGFFLDRFPKMIIVTWRNIGQALKLLDVEPQQDLKAYFL
jgi:serine/threonine-protein kinase/endoribonuclease IRE1